MKLYRHYGWDKEKEIVPNDITHMIIDDSVTSIEDFAFCNRCPMLVSLIMGDTVSEIGKYAFSGCRSLKFLRLSKVLEHIRNDAFSRCESLDVIFLPSTVKTIEWSAFRDCRSLRLLVLPDEINLDDVGGGIICNTEIERISKAAGVKYELEDANRPYRGYTGESCRKVHNWLIGYMNDLPLHTLSYKPDICAQQINHYLNEHGNESVDRLDPHSNMTPLHILAMNPYAPVDAIVALLGAVKHDLCNDIVIEERRESRNNSNKWIVPWLMNSFRCCIYKNQISHAHPKLNAVSTKDKRGKFPLDCAMEYNIPGFVRMYYYLYDHGTTEDGLKLLYNCEHGMTPLHMIAMNPYIPSHSIAALVHANMDDVACADNDGKTPLDHARECNVPGLLAMIEAMCMHSISVTSQNREIKILDFGDTDTDSDRS